MALFSLQIQHNTATPDGMDGTQVSAVRGETPATGGTSATDDGAAVPAGAKQVAEETGESAMAAVLACQTSVTSLAGAGDSPAQAALDLLS
ncbi:hypothetical protein [Roseobacter ponti]|uniref:Uncharacterized protein n=1 Tax=Roseobacter ponti TaxID=1891787 RepID=A0A858STD7_9RHOB|nr:hypothetical protein [Roseobacter ponti]QJF50973.1 hypothetical protein G3256_07285 [Roseobacter ponti]